MKAGAQAEVVVKLTRQNDYAGELKLELMGKYLIATDDGYGCGFGSNITFSNIYLKADN